MKEASNTKEQIIQLISQLGGFDEQLIDDINEIKLALHAISPLKGEPVDCVLWVPNSEIAANDYNPNAVAPPEMRLLEHSITEDGYTQPIVAWRNGSGYEVVDGFHRNRVGKESKAVRSRLRDRLPVTIINDSRADKGDRISSTIRHNRARGKHQVEAMSDIVIELKRRNWTDARISRELGMEQDEILRLCQITGLTELFADQEFSRAWDVEGSITTDDFVALTDDVPEDDDAAKVRTVNTSDESRVFHTYEKWECYKAGFYKTTVDGMSAEECRDRYRDFLSDLDRFGKALDGVVSEWRHSCEHYLTNAAMNRIAWLGQAAACYALGIPSTFRSGFSLMTDEEQAVANNLALEYLNRWLVANKRDRVTLEEAYTGRQSTIY